jgi:hypothetical protein
MMTTKQKKTTKQNYKKMLQANRISGGVLDYDIAAYWMGRDMARKLYDADQLNIDFLAVKARRINSGGKIQVFNRADGSKILVVR